MDLKELDTLGAAEKGLTFEVVHPFTKEVLTYKDKDGKDIPCKISVLGVGSRAYKQAEKKLELARKNSWARKHKDLDEDEERDLIMNIAVSCTTGWEGIEEDGKKIPFTKEEVARVFESYPWLSNQVTDQMSNIAEMLEKN